MSLPSRVSRFARRHSLWGADTRVIAAVSGGSDSIGLLVLLADLHSRGELTLDAVAHLHHGIRGAEADEDERHSRAVARDLLLPFITDRVDVPAAARAQRLSIEIAARRLRRAFLVDILRQRHADIVATGHTRDDQAETVMLRVARGTGLRGLGGIAPLNPPFARPLLECSRAEIRRELTRRGVSWREDATNAALDTPRNRVRHELLPAIARHFNPSIHRSLARLAALARTDEAALEREAVAAAVRLVEPFEDGRVRLRRSVLGRLPEAVARRVVRFALETLTGRSAQADEIAAILDIAACRVPRAELARVDVEHSGAFVVLRIRGPQPAPSGFQFDLAIPGALQSPDGIWQIVATAPVGREMVSSSTGFDPRAVARVLVDADTLNGGLVVRSRVPGDRFRPQGLVGRKKVQDLFVDRKVPREERDQVPIVTDESGRIVWVAGHALAAEFAVTERTKAVIILELRRGLRRGA